MKTLRRSILEIQIHILHALKFNGPTKPTQLLHLTNTAWGTEKDPSLMSFIKELESSGLVYQKYDDDGKYIVITIKGLQCLDLLERGIQMIRPLREVYQRS